MSDGLTTSRPLMPLLAFRCSRKACTDGSSFGLVAQPLGCAESLMPLLIYATPECRDLPQGRPVQRDSKSTAAQSFVIASQKTAGVGGVFAKQHCRERFNIGAAAQVMTAVYRKAYAGNPARGSVTQKRHGGGDVFLPLHAAE